MEAPKKIDQWYRILLFFRETPKNQAAMIEFFFEQFAMNPKEFLDLLQCLKKKLVSEQTPGKDKRSLANRYLSVISPLCERFGYYEIKMDLDDRCFFIADKKKFSQIEKKLASYQKKSEKLLKLIKRKFYDLLAIHGIEANIKGRYKNIHSIYRKLQKNHHASLPHIHDIFAFRIITKTNQESRCFDILGRLHDQFHPIPSRFKDYITIPKINGYRSLHTGLSEVIPEVSMPIEVQIRTAEMDEFAERGLAAHFLYAHKKKSTLLSEKEAKLIRHFFSLGKQRDEENRVNCFSHKGDLFQFRQGSNLVDFAHRIHTGLEKRAKGGLVNGQPKNLYARIKEGDIIHILTGHDVPTRLSI